jgi:4-hydroxy-tetrahydrodipicolinate reductase
MDPMTRKRGLAEDAVRVVLLGTGQMGTAAARILCTKQGLELVGVVARRPDRAGRDAGEVLGLPAPLGVAVTNDLAATLIATHPDVVLQTTCSRVAQAEPELVTCIEAGANVVSIAEELAYPWAGSPAAASRLDELARAHDVTVLGTGVNPGFVLDLLVIALTGVCAHVESITATRVNDLSPYGPTVLSTQGVGLTKEAFLAGVADGSVVGHFGFPESIAMIAAALGWEIDHVDQTREPIIATVRRETPFVIVEPGNVAGCRHTAVAYVGDRPVITLVHPQQVCPEREGIATGDTIEIVGEPPVRLSGSPEIPGGTATAALSVNMIPRVLDAPPGLVSMADLPVPGAIEGDVRRVLRHVEVTHA